MNLEPAASIVDAGRALRCHEVTSVELTRQAIDRIRVLDREIHAFTYLDAEGALAAAREADYALAKGIDLGPMHGIPYALKDIYDAQDMATTCGSRLRLDHIAASDSAVAARFRRAGAILLGKLATFEFALGGPSDDLPFPSTRNPWDLERIPGGSSSGSGAAIAAGFVAVAAGTCTTGSIRGPAAWCGAVGLKPTFGRISRHGVFPLSPSLDHCGMLSANVRDAAIALGIMAGHDPDDPESVDLPVPDYCKALEAGVSGFRVAVPRNLFQDRPDLTQDAKDGIEAALSLLAEHGAEVNEVIFPDHDLFLACSRVIMLGEAFQIHRKYLGTRLPEYGSMAARRFATGAAVCEGDLRQALRLQRHLTKRVDDIFATHDIIVTAISLAPPLKFAELHATGAWPLQSTPFNVTRHPVISVPIGLDRNGLPLAVQIAGRAFDEATLLRAARSVEKASGWEALRQSAMQRKHMLLTREKGYSSMSG